MTNVPFSVFVFECVVGLTSDDSFKLNTTLCSRKFG